MKRTKEERTAVNSIFKLLDDIVTPEVIRIYRNWQMGYITADEAQQAIAHAMYKESIEAPHRRALETYTEIFRA